MISTTRKISSINARSASIGEGGGPGSWGFLNDDERQRSEEEGKNNNSREDEVEEIKNIGDKVGLASETGGKDGAAVVNIEGGER